MIEQNTQTKQNDSPRIKPIENPKNLKTKLAYWLTKRKVGKVITPLKVAYARFPESLGLAKALTEMDDKFTIDKELLHLIQTYAATLNGCAFCMDIAKASYQKQRAGSQKMNDLMRFEESRHFSDSEKAALSYAGEATRNKEVSDETFERLKRCFNEKEIVQITMINAIENYYNLMNGPLNIGSDELCSLWSNGVK